MTEVQSAASLSTESSLPDNESISLIQRKKQQIVIEAAFARRTNPERAQKLAALCFNKTAGTVFMPFDLAEIALAETGGHRLSAHAVSSRGALGVWQLMPSRAKSHGYSSKDMNDDAKCAQAAVLELHTKLEMAQGNMERAKKLYCGQGPQADAYIKKIRRVRLEMLSEFKRQAEKLAMADAEQMDR
ncbi:MAG: transglycosylase SLT domain-containing protein [Desulfuromonadaceae bacterium]|nr:transglycosylase SLT domain-containing protein [Desulfuromonadaceae bacterium]